MVYQIEIHNRIAQKVVELLSYFKWVRLEPRQEQELPLITKSEFFAGLKESFEEMKLMEAGMLPKKTAWEVLDEVEKELADE